MNSEFFRELKALGNEYTSLKNENEALKRRMLELTNQAEAVVKAYDDYLEAKVDGRLDDIKHRSSLVSRLLSGLDLLAKREKLQQ